MPILAVKNAEAWPKLTLMPDGAIVATIHNQPSHLHMPADVDCWASEDGGRTWAKRGTPAPRDTERAARANVAAGLADNGDLIVISSGYSDVASGKGHKGRGQVLHPVVCRSKDGARTWTRDYHAFHAPWPEANRTKYYLVPFGEILAGEDGDLRVALYGGAPGATRVYRSRDDGRTWIDPRVMDKDAAFYEPALFHLGEGKWLAAVRKPTNKYRNDKGELIREGGGLDLYFSDDDARTWTGRGKLTGRMCHPGHIVRLRDGRLLLSYGNRMVPTGVDVRFSKDEGATWSEPYRVVGSGGKIGGYPSSVQRADGQVVTAFYGRGSPIWSGGRYMAVVIWEPTRVSDK